MSEAITVTIPTINPETITTLEAAQTTEHETVVAALAAIRVKYAPLAKHAGIIRTASFEKVTSNYRIEREAFYRDDYWRRPVHALLACDAWDSDNTDQNRGRYFGSRLYLLPTAEWLEITRVGTWSHWQGEPDQWYCGVDCEGGSEDGYDAEEYRDIGGSVRKLTDEQVVEEGYVFKSIVDQIAESLEEMGKKLPERLCRVKERTDLAAKLLAALTGQKRERLRMDAEHPQTDEHLAACASCMMAHDKALPEV